MGKKQISDSGEELNKKPDELDEDDDELDEEDDEEDEDEEDEDDPDSEKNKDKDKDEDDEDEIVTLKKSEHVKLLKERDDYRKRATSKDNKGKVDDDAPLSRKEFYKANQDKAIAIVSDEATDVPKRFEKELSAEVRKEIDANWDEVVKHYSSKSGKATPEAIVDDLLDAYAAFKRRTPPKEEGENKNAKRKVGQDAGAGGGKPQNQSKSRDKILGQSKGMKDWY